MHDVEPADDHVARELAAEHQELGPGAYHRDRLHDRGGDPQAGAGQQVIGQRVAGEALDQAQGHQTQPDQPVQLTGLAERAGEEHPEHVDQHRGHEQQRRPVVDLAHDQPAADVEGDVQRRVVGPRHLHAVQRHVGAVVADLGHRGVEEERQEGAGQQQDDERVERDLAHHERPVVGEDLVQLLAHAAGHAEPVLGPAAGLADRGGRLVEALGPLDGGLLAQVDRVGGGHGRSQNDGPTASG